MINNTHPDLSNLHSRTGRYRASIRPRHPKPLLQSLVLVAVVFGSSGVASASNDNFTYTFNAADQLVNVGWQHGAIADFTYDGDGLRISKTVGAQEVIYIRDASGEVLAEYDQDGALLAEYVYAGGRRVCKIVPTAGGGEERIYYHGDMVGTPLVETDDSGSEVFRGEYFPFGTAHLADGDADRYQFTGKELDNEIGLHYFHARYYDSRIGRFISVDPVGGQVGASQSWNRYSYTRNNPINLVDPDGRLEVNAIDDELDLELFYDAPEDKRTPHERLDAEREENPLVDAGNALATNLSKINNPDSREPVEGNYGYRLAEAAAHSLLDKKTPTVTKILRLPLDGTQVFVGVLIYGIPKVMNPIPPIPNEPDMETEIYESIFKYMERSGIASREEKTEQEK